jgi:hypothetical protein
MISVTFTGTSLGSVVSTPSLDRDRSPPHSGTKDKDKDGRSGNGSAGAGAVAVVESSSARKRNRDLATEVPQQAQANPRKR